MTNLKNILLLLLILPIYGYGQKPSSEIYVSINGLKSNNGTKEAPLADIHGALARAHELRLGDESALITIHLFPGDYYLQSPIVIPPELSNVNIIGSGADLVNIKGSAILKLDWKPFQGQILVSDIDQEINFDQLVVNDEIQILARYPNYDEDGGHWQGHAPDAISKERVKSWKNPEGAIFHAIHGNEWGDFHYVITGVNSDGTPVLEGGHQNNRPAPPHEEYRMIENVFEELDNPGEWFLDKENHKLYYWPEPEVDINKALFEGVFLKHLIEIKGSSENSARNIHIEGIAFEHAQRTIMETYEPLLRSDWTIYRGGAVFIEAAEDCSIQNCEFTNLAGNAIFISGYSRRINISDNHIHEIGASGICFVGDPSSVRSPSFQYSEFVKANKMDTIPGPQNELYVKSCLADNNLIYRIGRIEKQTAGVQISMAMDITVSFNSIYDVPRAGINIGDGTWGGHIIEYNDVFNTVLESGDHGSFNSWGRDRFWHPNRGKMDNITIADPDMPKWDAIETTIIRNNRFRCDHGWDIDLDDGSSNYYLYNNLCLNGGIKLREGFYRKVENNIMVNNGFHPHVWFVNSEDIFIKNIISTSHQDIRLKGWGKEVDYNLFPGIEALEKARENGTDKNSRAGDPQFKNSAAGDFSVENSSSALKLGFVNFPMDSFGVQNPGLKKIAKTPKIPELIFYSTSSLNDKETINWLGADIKNIETMEERSASGLSDNAGVIVFEIENNSIASRSGLKKEDVIILAEGNKVNNIQDLFRVYQENNWTGKLNLVVIRNQTEEKITIKTK